MADTPHVTSWPEDKGFLAVHQEFGGALVPRHAIDGLPELTAAIERLAAAFESPQDSPVWPTPTRFDPDDRDTWPEESEWVLLDYCSEWEKAQLLQVAHPFRWHVAWNRGDGFAAKAGDLWLPLPPTPGGEL